MPILYSVVLCKLGISHISDIDECTESNRCQQNCTNFDGSFKCVCTTGYTLENDGISCKGKILTCIINTWALFFKKKL